MALFLPAVGQGQLSFGFGGFGQAALSNSQPKKFGSNVPVQGGVFGTGTVLFHSGNTGNFATHGANTVIGYVGFRFNGSAAHHYYGWLHLKVTGDGSGNPVSVDLKTDGAGVFGAYNTQPDQGILTGQTISAIPEPASVATDLALFALGAVGVREHRRRRQRAA